MFYDIVIYSDLVPCKTANYSEAHADGSASHTVPHFFFIRTQVS